MCKWNEHVAACPVFADMYLSFVCELFARRHAPYIVKHKLRYVFLLHLINLWDHSLLSVKHVEACMAIVDDAIAANAQDNS